ncbi:MAG: T9SS type A sorting domain-containing protein [Ignavibacteria bacterium]|nr:T9SS type A sorting domain-containing protein [Ignavibacteria bacterium]
MKKFTILLVLFVATLSIGSAQVQKRVTISSMPDVKLDANNIVGIPGLVNSNESVLSPNLPLINRLTAETDAPVLPTYLSVAAIQRVVFNAPQDTSDSGWQLSNADTNIKQFLWPIINELPAKVNTGAGSEDLFGFGQFFPSFGKSGTFTIDTIVMLPFQWIQGEPAIPVTQSVLFFGFAVKTNLQTASGNSFRFDDPGLRQLGGGELEIPADTINTRTIATAANRYGGINATVIPVPNWTVNADESFGFILYMQNTTDKMNLYGTYLWNERDSIKTLGYVLRRNAAGNEFVDKQGTYSRDFSTIPELLNGYPSLHRRGLRASFFCNVYGMLDTPDGVETLTDDAKEFALEPVTPNPVAGATKIQFSLQQPSQVSLRVTNSLGQVVKELASGAMNTGTYSADFDANDLPTGMYYYTLVAGMQSLTRSMVVVK